MEYATKTMSSKKLQRQQSLLEQLRLDPTLRVSQMAAKLGVTTETIRRDLEELADRGEIDRTWGGAMLRKSSEPAVSERRKLQVRERAAIARTTLERLAGAKVLMLGSGATTTEVARQIAIHMTAVTVITHCTSVAAALAVNEAIEVIMAPGHYHLGEAAVHGAHTLTFLQSFNVDVCVLGASGLGVKGPSDALIDAAAVYSTMIAQSSRCLLVADHSKFDCLSTATFAEWQMVSELLTDRAPSGPLKAAIEAASTSLVICPLEV